MSNKPTGVHKKITLRASNYSGLGKTLEYLQSIPLDDKECVSETLQARFLPFVLDKSDPQTAGIARQCMVKCLGYAQAIALEWGWESLFKLFNSSHQITEVRSPQSVSQVSVAPVEELSDCEPEAEELLETQSNDDDEEEYGKNGYYGEDKDGVDGLGRLILGDLLND